MDIQPGSLFKQKEGKYQERKYALLWFLKIYLRRFLTFINKLCIKYTLSTFVSLPLGYTTAPSCLPGLGCPLRWPLRHCWSLLVWKTATLNWCSIFCQLDEVRHQRCVPGEPHTESSLSPLCASHRKSHLWMWWNQLLSHHGMKANLNQSQIWFLTWIKEFHKQHIYRFQDLCDVYILLRRHFLSLSLEWHGTAGVLAASSVPAGKRPPYSSFYPYMTLREAHKLVGPLAGSLSPNAAGWMQTSLWYLQQ